MKIKYETPVELVHAWIHEYLAKRSFEGTLALLSEDIRWIGTAAHEKAIGLEAVKTLLLQNIQSAPESLDTQILSCDVFVLTQNLYQVLVQIRAMGTATQHVTHLHCTFVCKQTECGLALCAIHTSVPHDVQTGHNLFPVEHSKQSAETDQELNAFISCMPGSVFKYQAEGSGLFAFISDQIFSMLGYTKEEFVQKFDNRFENMVYAADRQRVLNEINAQIGFRTDYTFKYRVENKNGALRWFYDVRKLMVDKRGIKWFYVALVDMTKQKKNLEQPFFRERMLQAVMEHSNLYVWEFHIQSGICLQSVRCGEKFGLPPVLEHFPESLLERGVIADESIDTYLDLHQKIKDGFSERSADVKLRWADGTFSWNNIKYVVLFDESGVPLRAIGTALNIDEKKTLEEKYHQIATYQKMSAANVILYVKFDLTQNLLVQEESRLKFSDYLKGCQTMDAFFEQVYEKNFEFSCLEEYRSIFSRDKLLHEFQNGNFSLCFEHRYHINTHQSIWVNTEVDMIKNPYTNHIEALLYVTDIHDKKMVELLIDRIAQQNYDCIIVIDTINDYFRHYNQRKKDWDVIASEGAYTENNLAYIKTFVLEEYQEICLEKTSLPYIQAQLETQSSYSFHITVHNKKGDLRVKKIEIFYVDEQQKIACLSRMDVTDLVAVEQQKTNALNAALTAAQQANAAKTDFLSRMSHEIRTPLNAIIGMSAIAAQSIGDDEQVADCISKIGISSRFLLSLINDILNMSRIESGKMLLQHEKFSFASLLSDVNSICETQADAKEIEYSCIVDHHLQKFYMGDAIKLQQVVINVLSNAIKFTPNGGKVSLSVQQKASSQQNDTIRFVVNDTGCGISNAFLPHLFDPFSQEHIGTTSQYAGTGLGLSICKNLVTLMDGQIAVRSIAGVGSEFTIDVKLECCNDEVPQPQTKPTYHFPALRTLVVDDDLTVCEYTAMILRDMGIKTEWANSGRKAIHRVNEMREHHKPYDIIILDWKIPDMDGIETAKEIRQIVGPAVTMIMMTAYEWASIEHEARLAGINLLMNKPLFQSSLVSVFNKIMDQKEESRNGERQTFDLEGKRILLVEDHPMNVEIATKLLEAKQMLVTHAENGVRGVELFATAKAGYYDAILMDIRMPIMDGLQAAKTIRHLNKAGAKTIPIIAMTANAFDDDVEKSKQAGMNFHLAKPIEPAKLYECLAQFLTGSVS